MLRIAAEKTEEVANCAYEAALKKDLPPDARTMV